MKRQLIFKTLQRNLFYRPWLTYFLLILLLNPSTLKVTNLDLPTPTRNFSEIEELIWPKYLPWLREFLKIYGSGLKNCLHWGKFAYLKAFSISSSSKTVLTMGFIEPASNSLSNLRNMAFLLSSFSSWIWSNKMQWKLTPRKNIFIPAEPNRQWKYRLDARWKREKSHEEKLFQIRKYIFSGIICMISPLRGGKNRKSNVFETLHCFTCKFDFLLHLFDLVKSIFGCMEKENAGILYVPITSIRKYLSDAYLQS